MRTLGIVVLLLVGLSHGGQRAAFAEDRPVIVISRSALSPERLAVHVGELVRWQAAGGGRLQIDLDRHPGAHEIVTRTGEITAIFLQAGEHSYAGSLLEDGHSHFRGTIIVRKAASPWALPPTCGKESSDRICFAQ